MKKLILTGAVIGIGIYVYSEYVKKKAKTPCSCSKISLEDKSNNIRLECEKKVNEEMLKMRFITAPMMENHRAKAISSCIEANS